jgi:hypothetical protein
MTVVSSWGCLGLDSERRSDRLITGTRVPHRVPPPTLRIGMFRRVFFLRLGRVPKRHVVVLQLWRWPR